MKRPARSIKIEKETTHDLMRWPRVDGTPTATEEHGGVVVRHLETPSTTAAEDQETGTGKHDRFTQEEEVRELHGRALKPHHPVGDRRL